MSFYIPLTFSLLTLFCVAGILIAKTYLQRTGASGSRVSIPLPASSDTSCDDDRRKSSAGISSEDASS